ncbi:MAG TPA: aminopeptidase [Kofleriaceae bacterium]|jgi:predicted aminopeptidase|nr:aminopeptidase [Kofleriaceae bacterium]
MPRYLAQAAYGQLDLLQRARPLDQVVNDPNVDLRTRMLLSAIPDIKAFGAAHGLDTRHNYDNYVELDSSAAVWFVGASDPVAFEPLQWCFPIAGCFAGLGWFDQDDAFAQRDELAAKGYDSFARPADAYSTGGWFHDPVVSSMLSDGDDAWQWLANVILHESTHATVFIPDEPDFNEGFAEFVGDHLADDWLVGRFGESSDEVANYRDDLAKRAARVSRELVAYKELEALYESDAPRAEKLAKKDAIIDALADELKLRERPNNATLIELRVYEAAGDGFTKVQAACGGSVAKMIAAAKKLKRSDFKEELQPDLRPVLAHLADLCR